MNAMVIMHNMIIDICINSSPECRIRMGKKLNKQLNEVKQFNYGHIYKHPRFEPLKHYSELAISQIF